MALTTAKKRRLEELEEKERQGTLDVQGELFQAPPLERPEVPGVTPAPALTTGVQVPPPGATADQIPSPAAVEPTEPSPFLKALAPTAVKMQPTTRLGRLGQLGFGALEATAILQRAGGLLRGQSITDPGAGIFTPETRARAQEIRQEAIPKPFTPEELEQEPSRITFFGDPQAFAEVDAISTEIAGEFLSDPFTYIGLGAPLAFLARSLRRGARLAGPLRKAGIKTIRIGNQSIPFEGSDDLAVTFQRTEDLLTPSERQGTEIGFQFQKEQQSLIPGGAEVFQRRREKLRDQFLNKLIPKVQKEISPGTFGKTTDEVVENLDTLIKQKQKSTRKELAEKFDNLHIELEALDTPPLKQEIKGQVDEILQDSGILDIQGSPLSFDVAGPGVANEKVFNEFLRLNKALEGEGVIEFSRLRQFRRNLRNSASVQARAGDNLGANQLNDMADTFGNYMQEVAERAGRGNEFRQLDESWGVFKTTTEKIRKILDKPIEQQALQIAQLTKKDKETLRLIMDQSPEAADAVKDLIFSSFLKQAKSFKAGEEVVNIDKFQNLMVNLGDETIQQIFGSQNKELMELMLNIGHRGNVFKKIKPVFGGPGAREAASILEIPRRIRTRIGAETTMMGIPQLLAEQLTPTGAARFGAGVQRFGPREGREPGALIPNFNLQQMKNIVTFQDERERN